MPFIRTFVCVEAQSTIFQSCRDGATASWVINQNFRGVKCLAQGHNTAEVGFEPETSRSGVRHSTTEPPRSPLIRTKWVQWHKYPGRNIELLERLNLTVVKCSFYIENNHYVDDKSKMTYPRFQSTCNAYSIIIVSLGTPFYNSVLSGSKYLFTGDSRYLNSW